MAATRRATRVRAKMMVKVGFVSPADKFVAPLVDFSPFGLSVKTSHEVAIGAIFKMGIAVGTDYFRAASIVRAQIPGGFAVEFLSMTALDRETMRRLYLRLQMAAREG